MGVFVVVVFGFAVDACLSPRPWNRGTFTNEAAKGAGLLVAQGGLVSVMHRRFALITFP